MMKKLLPFIAIVLFTVNSIAQTARVQVIHNSADAAAAEVDIYVNSDLALDNFAFRTATPFLDLPAGVQIELSVAPGNSTSVSDALLTVPITLEVNEKYIVIADGIVSATGYNPAPALSLQVYPLAREAASNPANVDVLVHHGSSDAPTVDVVETGVGAGTIVDDISFTEFQGYLELPADDYVLEIRDGSGMIGVAAYQAPLEALNLDGSALIVLASGFLDPSQNSNGPAFGLFVATAAGGDLLELPSAPISQTARVQVVHNSADAAAAEVDVYVNSDLALDNFAFRTATPFIDLPAGVQIELSIAPSNSTSASDALLTVSITLDVNEKYIVVADGIVSGTGYNPAPALSLQVFPMAREMASDPANVDVLVHHGSTDAPTVDVVETGVGAGTVVDDISYTEFQGYLELPTADYTLEVRDASGTVGVAAYQTPLATLNLGGSALTVLASGFLDPTQNSNGPAFGLYVATASGGALLELPSAPLGVSEFNSSEFVMYPNPVRQNLNISASGLNLSKYSFTISDMLGRQIISGLEINIDNSIDVSYLSEGIYNLTIQDGNRIISTKKFIKN